MTIYGFFLKNKIDNELFTYIHALNNNIIIYICFFSTGKVWWIFEYLLNCLFNQKKSGNVFFSHYILKILGYVGWDDEKIVHNFVLRIHVTIENNKSASPIQSNWFWPSWFNK